MEVVVLILMIAIVGQNTLRMSLRINWHTDNLERTTIGMRYAGCLARVWSTAKKSKVVYPRHWQDVSWGDVQTTCQWQH